MGSGTPHTKKWNLNKNFKFYFLLLNVIKPGRTLISNISVFFTPPLPHEKNSPPSPKKTPRQKIISNNYFFSISISSKNKKIDLKNFKIISPRKTFQQHNTTQFNPIQSNSTQFNLFHLNSTQFNPIQPIIRYK